MRHDAIGFFWRDEPPPPKQTKEKVKRMAPKRLWEADDYLPHFEEASNANFPFMNFEELVEAGANEDILIFDLECYTNLFFIAFVSYRTGKYIFVRTDEGSCNPTQHQLLAYIFSNCKVLGFNSRNYDMPLISCYMAGHSTDKLKEFSDAIIKYQVDWRDILKSHKIKKVLANHIDIQEVAPLSGSLKTYSGRIHAPRMQDLPFHPDTILSDDQKTIIVWYCANDLTNTAFLRASLEEQCKLREVMTREYQIDLRSKSDAQIAEAVIVREVTKLRGGQPLQRQDILMPGVVFWYQAPSGMEFKTRDLQWTLEFVKSLEFPIGPSGKIVEPEALKSFVVPIAEGQYRMGIGGLHSSEERTSHIATSQQKLFELDVTSYYPFIILNLGLQPESMGRAFTQVYSSIVRRRLDAKRAGQKVIADSLKITINGTFGKLNSPYSFLYSPRSMFQVTVSGQLYLLMLIESLEMHGISIVSANTDGIVAKCGHHQVGLMQRLVAEWEAVTGFDIEQNELEALYSRDVNNYVAVKKGYKGVKTKGAFASAGLSKNPVNEITIDAIEALLTKGVPYAHTVNQCQDVRKFLTVRNVRGGAVKINPDSSIEYLGKVVRWYYAKGEDQPLVYAESGNHVPKSKGARPLMLLENFAVPDDLDRDWYVEETRKMLVTINYLQEEEQDS